MEESRDYSKLINEYRKSEILALNSLNLDQINEVINILEKTRIQEKHIFICGNGGSGATASHFASDFTKGINEWLLNRDGMVKTYRVECLNDNVPALMAIANDIGYDEIFRFMLRAKMDPDDVVIGISGSGNSKNVINALEYANENGGQTIAIVGYDGGRLKKIAKYYIHAEIDDMQISEDVHMMLNHMMMWVLTRE